MSNVPASRTEVLVKGGRALDVEVDEVVEAVEGGEMSLERLIILDLRRE